MIEVEDVHTDFWKKHHADGECSFDALVQKGGYEYDDFCATYYKYEKGLLRPDGQPGFNTPSGRIELVPSIFTAWGIPPYPVYTPAPETWETTPEVMEELPFYMINGARSYEFFHSEHRQVAYLRELVAEPDIIETDYPSEFIGLPWSRDAIHALQEAAMRSHRTNLK